MHRLNAEKKKPEPEIRETNIVHILAKVKGHIVRHRVDALEFLRNYDKHNEFAITRTDFKRSIDSAGFNLTETELETLMDV